MGFFSNRLEALLQGEVKEYLGPLAGVPHIGEIEPVPSLVSHPSKARLECWGDSVRVRAGIGCAEVEIALVPLREEIGDVVELGLLGRRLHVLGPETVVYELLGFPAHLDFYRGRYLGLLRFRWAIHPDFATLGHCFIPSTQDWWKSTTDEERRPRDPSMFLLLRFGMVHLTRFLAARYCMVSGVTASTISNFSAGLNTLGQMKSRGGLAKPWQSPV